MTPLSQTELAAFTGSELSRYIEAIQVRGRHLEGATDVLRQLVGEQMRRAEIEMRKRSANHAR